MQCHDLLTRTLEDGAWRRILHHAIKDYPIEACGILLSPVESPRHITEARPTRNTTLENPSTRYCVDPKALVEVYAWGEKRGLDVCGFYHSHPDHPPFPSEYDRRSVWEGYLYVILSIVHGTFKGAKAWVWFPEEEQFRESIIQRDPREGYRETTSSSA